MANGNNERVGGPFEALSAGLQTQFLNEPFIRWIFFVGAMLLVLAGWTQIIRFFKRVT